VFRTGWFSATITKGAGKMRVAKANQRTMAILGTVAFLSIVAAQPFPAVASTSSEPYIFASAGGPYSGTVGEPITFDASVSYVSDGNDVATYCWDWNGENQFECIGGGPIIEHTWHCAFTGYVRVYTFADFGDVAWDEAYVKVTGPETALCVTLQGDADLHVYGCHKQHVGIDYATNGPEKQICDALWWIADAEGKNVSLTGCTPDESMTQTIRFPLYSGEPFDIRLVGVRDGAFNLTVQGYQDGACVAVTSYKGDVFAGETISVSATACCQKSDLSVSCGPLCYCPELKVAPDKIKVPVELPGTYDTSITLSETSGLRPLRSVTLKCGDIKGQVHTIKGSDVTFDLNGFDIAPGGEQTVQMSIPVPEFFFGSATGSLSVECLDGAGKSVEVTIKKTGLEPVCNPGGPYEGVVGKPITFDGGWSYDPDGTIQQFCWDWDWDGEFECTGKSKIQHTWNETFKGMVLLRVIDNEGQSAEESVLVTVNTE
jgi:PKD domain